MYFYIPVKRNQLNWCHRQATETLIYYVGWGAAGRHFIDWRRNVPDLSNVLINGKHKNQKINFLALKRLWKRHQKAIIR